MSGFKSNIQPNPYQRFMDINEPLTMMTPIKGYEQMPIVPLEQAVKPLLSIVPEIEQMVHIAKTRCKKPPADNLTIDQSAAIMLYTMEWTPKESSVYYILNAALRTEHRQLLKPWFSYLKLLLTALELLPSKPCVVYRGVRGIDKKNQYKKGGNIVWWGFSSCTSTMNVLYNESFLGTSGDRTFFLIKCQNGKDIRKHSYFKDEDEVLLPPAREFQVEEIIVGPDGLSGIQLNETQPKFPLLESFQKNNQFSKSGGSSNSKSFLHKSSVAPVSHNQVFK